MPITALFAGILAPLYILLALRVSAARRSGKVALGDGGDKNLSRRIRVHANFAEYAPFALVFDGIGRKSAGIANDVVRSGRVSIGRSPTTCLWCLASE